MFAPARTAAGSTAAFHGDAASAQVQVCQGRTWAAALWVQILGLGKFKDLCIECVQHRQCKREAVGSAVDAIYQDALGHGNPIGLELQGQVGVRHFALFAQFLNQLFGSVFVKLPRLHLLVSCIVFDALILKSTTLFRPNASNLMHLHKPHGCTGDQFEHE